MKRLTFLNERKKHFDWQCENNEVADKLATYEDAEEHGRLVVLPCKVGDTVYTIQADYFACEKCQHKEDAHYNPLIQRTSCSMDDRHCPLFIKEHIAEGFEVSKSESGDAQVSNPGEWGYEGLETFSSFDGRCYYTREAAEKALEGMG